MKKEEEEEEDKKSNSDLDENYDSYQKRGLVDMVRINGKDVVIPKVDDFKTFRPKEDMEVYNDEAVIMVSPRRSGKTVLLKWYCYQNRKKYDTCYIFSGSINLQDKDTYDFVPEDNRISFFDEKLLSQIYDNQVQDVETKLKNKQEHLIKHILIVMDDLISENIRNSVFFNNIFIKGRHARIGIIVLSQVLSSRVGVSSTALSNCDLFIAFQIREKYSRKCLVEKYLSNTEHEKIGTAIYQNIVNSEEYTSVCILTRKHALRYTDFVYKLKCPLKVPKFMIGKKELLSTTIPSSIKSKTKRKDFSINIDPDYEEDAIQIEY